MTALAPGKLIAVHRIIVVREQPTDPHTVQAQITPTLLSVEGVFHHLCDRAVPLAAQALARPRQVTKEALPVPHRTINPVGRSKSPPQIDDIVLEHHVDACIQGILQHQERRGGHALAIRRHIASDMALADWADSGAFSALTGGTEVEPFAGRTHRTIASDEAETVLRDAVLARRNILVSGGTSTGKTTFLNALLAEVPMTERLILIEDAEELRIAHPNAVGLIAVRGKLGEADASAEDLLIAALRMRPDRIILGELRGQEAFTFLRAVNTGHPGSITTIHADSPHRAIEQLVLLVLQGGSPLRREDVGHYILQSVDVFVQLERRDGKRRVQQIMMAE